MWRKETICLTPEEAQPILGASNCLRDFDEDEPNRLYSVFCHSSRSDRDWPLNRPTPGPLWHEFDLEDLLSAKEWFGKLISTMGPGSKPDRAVRAIEDVLKPDPNQQVGGVRAHVSPPFNQLDPIVRDYFGQVWGREVLTSYERRANAILDLWADHFQWAVETGEPIENETWDTLVSMLKSAGASFEHYRPGMEGEALSSCAHNLEIRLFKPGDKAEVFWFDTEEHDPDDNIQQIHPPLALLFFLSPTSNPGFAPYSAEHPKDGTIGEAWHGRLTAPKIFSCHPKWWDK